MATLFAEKLKALRLDRKLTQVQMAELLCVDASRISRLEHDEHPSTHFIERLNKVFGVNAFEWMIEAQRGDEEHPGHATTRVIHLKAANTIDDDQEVGFRSRAVDLLARMTDLLESLIRSSRGGGGGGVVNGELCDPS